jgi:hypothetical protein
MKPQHISELIAELIATGKLPSEKPARPVRKARKPRLKKIDQGIYTYRGWRIERKTWTLPHSVEWYAIKGDEEDEYPTLREAREWIDELAKVEGEK